MEELVARISSGTGVEPETTKRAVGMMLAFLRNAGPRDEVDALFAAMPGAAEAAAAAEGEDEAGAGGGGLIGLASRLTGLHISVGEMQAIGQQVFAYLREKGGNERVGAIVSAIPGAGQFL